MNIVFMGTPDFAVESLSKLYDSGHNIMAVVSQPDRPSGRGMKLKYTPVKEYAISKDIQVFQTEKIRKDVELIENIRKLKPDVIVVVAFGQILPKEVLDSPKYGCVNVHGSLLPEYRGAAPMQWSLINGDEYTGITTMFMDVGMDTGDMLLKEKIKIEDDDNFGTLYEKMKKLGGKLIVETLEKIADGTATRIKQGDEHTLAPMISKETCKIDWNKSARDIRNLIRGLNPMPGAYTSMDGQMIKIWDSKIVDEKSEELPGTIILSDSKKGLYVATGDGVLGIEEIQLPNARRMNVLECLRGKKVEQGTILM